MKTFTKSTQSFINRNEEGLTSYLRDLRHLSPLTDAEEAKILKAIQQGGKAGERAQNRLAEANLPFVITVANQFQGGGMSLADLIQEGNMGMVEAARKYDPSMKFRFITYAVWYIRKSILDALDKYGHSTHISDNKLRVFAAYKKYKQANPEDGDHAKMLEFCDANDIDICDLYAIVEATTKATSFDAPVRADNDGCATYLNFTPSSVRTDAGLDNESLSIDLHRAMSALLTEREQFIISHIYGLGCPILDLREVSKLIGVGYEQTRINYHKAIAKLRTASSLPILRDHYMAA